MPPVSLSLGLVGLQLFFFFSEEIPWWIDEDASLLEEHCGSCHEAEHPRGFAKSPAGWRDTVEVMLGQMNEDESQCEQEPRWEQGPSLPLVRYRIRRMQGQSCLRLGAGSVTLYNLTHREF